MDMIYFNTVLYWFLISLSLFVAYKMKIRFFLGAIITYCLLFAVSEFSESVLNIPVWNQTERTTACYDWFEQYLVKDYDKNKDYSEGIFEDDYSMSLKEATENKYKYVFDKLGLKPGMTLLDAGCGTGVWMEYCRARGVDVTGLTLSEEQAKKVRQKGLKVLTIDYRKENKDFINRFDRITALGSSEHISTSRGWLGSNAAKERSNRTFVDTWKLFHSYLKPSGKCYITALTINTHSKWSWKDYFQCYILERHYGGCYSTIDTIKDKIVPNTGFTISDIQDTTKDYHWSSVADKDHFGHWSINWKEGPLNKISYIIKGLITDPFLVHHWLYYAKNTWMWQFGGYQDTPLTDEQVSTSPMLLKYFLLEKTEVQPKIELWGTEKSPFVRKVIDVLEYKQMQYQMHEQPTAIFLQRIGEPVPTEFSRISPLGKIPAISIDGVGVSDSSVIVRLIEKVNGYNSLYPEKFDQLAKTLWLEKYADSVMVDVCYKLFVEKLAKPKYYGVETDVQLVNTLEKEKLPVVLQYLESILMQDQGEYLVGDQISIADFSVVEHLVGLDMAAVAWKNDQYPNLIKYFEKMMLEKSMIKKRSQFSTF